MSKKDKSAQTPVFVTAFKVAKAVLSAFIGIRKQSDLENDAAELKPAQLIIGGLIGAMLFVMSLLLLVKMIVN